MVPSVKACAVQSDKTFVWVEHIVTPSLGSGHRLHHDSKFDDNLAHIHAVAVGELPLQAINLRSKAMGIIGWVCCNRINWNFVTPFRLYFEAACQGLRTRLRHIVKRYE